MESNQSYIKSLVGEVPELYRLYKQHLTDNDELIPDVFFREVTRYVEKLFKEINLKDMGDYDNTKYVKLKTILDRIENGMRSNVDEEVEELIVLSFLKELDCQEISMKPLFALFGHYTTLWFNRLWKVSIPKEIIEPDFGYELEGYIFIGRGSTGNGWSRSSNMLYRCVVCGDSMQADHNDYFTCSCGSMNLDFDAGRFWSNHGNKNILTYKKDS